MSTLKTTFRTDQDNRGITRTAHPSARDVQQEVKFAVFSYTLAAAMVAADVLQLGSLQVEGAVVIPELSRVKVSSSSIKAIYTLQSLATTSGASAVAESAALTLDGASALHAPLVRVASGNNTSLAHDSNLQVLISTVSGFAGGSAADVVTVEVAYRSPKFAC